MTTWTDPKTWSTGELVTALDMNTYVRDNLLYLKNANNLTYVSVDQNYSTTSASFVDVDASNLRLNVTSSGGLIIVGMLAAVRNYTSLNALTFEAALQFDVAIDGSRQGGTHGLHTYIPGGRELSDRLVTGHLPFPTGFQVLLPSLAADTYEMDLQWRKYSQQSNTAANEIVNAAGGGMPTLFYALEVAI